MKGLRVATLIALSAAPLVGCSTSETDSTLTVEGAVSLCSGVDGCVNFPAAGARVRVLDVDGRTVSEGVLAEDGRADFKVPAGSYTATLSLPDLNLATQPADGFEGVTLQGDGDAGDLSIVFPPIAVQ